MITKISGLNIKNKPIFTAKEKIVREGAKLALQSATKKPMQQLLNKIAIKFKMLKMRFKTPNS